MNWSGEAVVVGGGLAGLSAAIGLRRAGMAVRVFEQSAGQPRRVCGAFLSPEACFHADWLGIGERARRIGSPCENAEICLPRNPAAAWPLERRGQSGLALRRRDLESILRAQCASEGVQFCAGRRITKWVRSAEGGWRVYSQSASGGGPESWNAHVLVAADGRFSLARDHGHLPSSKTGWYGWNAEFEGGARQPGSLSLFLTHQGYFGLLTFADGRTNVCGLARLNRQAGLIEARDRIIGEASGHPSLKGFFAAARRTEEWKGVGPLPYGSYADAADGIFMAGDAAGVGDPYMGEGIARALAAGPMLYDSFSKNSQPEAAWRSYVRSWRSRYGRRQKTGGPLRWWLGGPVRIALAAALLRRGAVRRWILSTAHSVAR